MWQMDDYGKVGSHVTVEDILEEFLCNTLSKGLDDGKYKYISTNKGEPQHKMYSQRRRRH